MLAYRFFVDGLEDFLHKLTTHLALLALTGTLLENLIVAGVLEYGHAMLFLEHADFACHTHTLGQFLYETIITFINLLTQLTEVFGAVHLVTDDEHVEDVFE